ncbi:hypothetical protein DYB25_005504 [Aphanomyces astaci]|uniref:Cyclin-like domain-containing protein n=1 Tax=Aphanomyces astaci TaxID=112090 RepID=A0A397D921_APHAT|nr:hypothetical protein DYB25_005504 [Aphanomyces astaci]RHY58242.1 hypothetical protein DYB38_000644 [Aphanomyces astaci]RHY59765.1 hypothetical protein DYB34_007045 [Aphanomyces astaci]RHY77500.1 hypothetical protein DYB30_006546 [Aphanomyces astaci]RHZ15762.1 hypothetical protein DYB26_004499 [Aphanomyces astaci]
MMYEDDSLLDLSCDEDLLALGHLDDTPQLMMDATADLVAELMRREQVHRPDAAYLSTVQRDGMDASWRVRIAAWMVAVATEFHFADETMDLAVNYLDRYLSTMSASQHDLQLVGLVALLIASKFHEPDALLVAEAVNLAQLAGFTGPMIRTMETSMLRVLEWNLHVVVPTHFVDCFVADLNYSSGRTLRDACQPFLAASRVSHEALAFLPSQVAAAVVTLACQCTHDVASPPPLKSSSQLFEINATQVDLCRRHLLQHCEPERSSMKRDRSPSPLGVDDLVDESARFCPLVVKRPKCQVL